MLRVDVILFAVPGTAIIPILKRCIVLRLSIAAIVLAASSQSMAAILVPFAYDGRQNDVSFNNYEQILRAVPLGTGDVNLGGIDYHLLNPRTELPAVDDLFVQIYNANGLDIDTGNVPGAYVAQEFTAYGVQRVAGFGPPSQGASTDIRFGAALVDPFGVLTAADLVAGVAIKFYYDNTHDFTHSSGGDPAGFALPSAANLIADVASATTGGTGQFWASFGFGPATDGGASTPIGFFESDITGSNLTSTRSSDLGQAITGLNVFQGPPGVVFSGIVSGVNDLEYSVIGQASFGVNVQNNLNTVGLDADYKFLRSNGDSNWSLASDDPFSFTALPEPGTLVVWAGLAAMTVYGAKRRMQS